MPIRKGLNNDNDSDNDNDNDNNNKLTLIICVEDKNQNYTNYNHKMINIYSFVVEDIINAKIFIYVVLFMFAF